MSANRQVISASLESFFATTPVFTLHQLEERLHLTPEQALDRVKYHVKRGHVVNLERGLYAVVPLGSDPETFQPDRYLAAAAARPDAVFSHHAALELLGAAHSDWNICTLFTARRRRKLVLRNAEVQFLSHPTPLVQKRQERLGTRQVERRGFLLRVTGPERTLVEGFRSPRHVGGLAELMESASGFGVLDLELLKQVLRLYGQKSLWAATGWFLERFRETFFVGDEDLALFEKNRPRSPQYLPRGHRAGVFESRWNLVLPANVVAGGEPDEPE